MLRTQPEMLNSLQPLKLIKSLHSRWLFSLQVVSYGRFA